MDFPTTSIEDHVCTLWVHGYILLEKEGNYSLELQDYARCWLLVYLYKRLLGKGSLICLNLFKIRSWAGNVMGENQLANLYFFFRWTFLCHEKHFESSQRCRGDPLLSRFGAPPWCVEVCSYLRKCSVIYSSAAEALDGGVDQLTSKMEQTCIWKGNH